MKYSDLSEIKIRILSNDSDESLQDKMERAMLDLPPLSTKEKIRLKERLEDEINGYGVLEPLLKNPEISEIMINGIQSCYIEINGTIEKYHPIFESIDHLMQLIYRIASEVGREINQANPILDARLKDGSRVNVVLNPVSINGPTITIRKFNKKFLGAEELLQSNMLSNGLNEFLIMAVHSKLNLFISGGTGTGKTTLLNYLAQHVPKNERIITIEDAAEINIQNGGHIISMETKNASSKDHTISMSKLIKNALRMRPDRIIVGEVRGEEVLDMLQAMNTGHDGSISTGHANGPNDMLVRLEVVASNHSGMNNELIRKQIISAIDLIIHIERMNGRREVAFVGEIEKNRNEYQINPIYQSISDKELVAAELLQRVIRKQKFDRYCQRYTQIGA